MLLREDGQRETVAASELPEPEEPAPGPDGTALRSSAGRLLQGVVWRCSGQTKRKWDPDQLEEATLASVCDESASRLLALDALALGAREFLDRRF